MDIFQKSHTEHRQNGRQKIMISLIIGCLAFCVYTCMYAIRKPFTALVYNETIWGYGVKSWMVITQLIGYTFSKFAGIKWLGELKSNHRQKTLVLILLTASIPLLLLPLSNYRYWPLWMFFNGFPLGLIWGIVFSYVEGRDLTEFIGAILACTFIFSSGFVKSIAVFLQNNHIKIELIPFTIAIFAFIPAIILSFLLEKMPTPSTEEIQKNAHRTTLTKTERKQLIQKYLGFITAIILLYGFLTLIRDVRDNFGAEIMLGLKIYNAKSIAEIETLVTVFMLLCIPFICKIKNHLNAIKITLLVTGIGGIFCIGSTILFQNQLINGIGLLLLSGSGVYLGYILINISVMNRLIGFNGTAGNSGFLVYMADSAGYLCSLSISSIAIFSQKGKLPWLIWYQEILFWGGLIVIIFSIIAFKHINKYKSLQL